MSSDTKKISNKIKIDIEYRNEEIKAYSIPSTTLEFYIASAYFEHLLRVIPEHNTFFAFSHSRSLKFEYCLGGLYLSIQR